MGNKESKHQQNKKQQNEQTIVNHPKFKKFKFMNNFQLMRIQLCVENISAFKQWENLYSQLDFYEDQYLLLPRTCSFRNNTLCGKSGIVQIDYQNYHYILTQELQNRKDHSEHLQQSQIWYLFYGLITASSSFQKINSKCGDIRPSNIFLNDVGQVKIANRCSWPNQKTNYQKTLIDQQPTYISPQQIKQLQLGNLNNDLDPYISQAFSIGITMLQTVLLQDSSNLYDYDFKQLKNCKFYDRKLFDKLIKLWKFGYQVPKLQEKNQQMYYSWELKHAISALCEINPKDRISINQLYKWLRPHQTQIINIQPFVTKLQKPPLQNIQKYERIRQKIQQGNFGSQITTPNKIHKLHSKNLSSINQKQQKRLSNMSYLQTDKIDSQKNGHLHYPSYTQTSARKNNSLTKVIFNTQKNDSPGKSGVRDTYVVNNRLINRSVLYTPVSFTFSDLSSIKGGNKQQDISHYKQQSFSFNHDINSQRKADRSKQQSY